jgi:nicotinate-nucleotide pyrophosphorylase (carboxylating)
MKSIPREDLRRLIDMAIWEDVRDGDITSQAVIAEDASVKAHIVAREDMVLAGLYIAEQVFGRLDGTVQIDRQQDDGDHVGAGTVCLVVSGKARAILSAERIALNFVQHLSGIATLSDRYVKKIEGTGATLLDTRKTTPGLRAVEKYATRMGGARNHRMGLYDAIMIKDNHIAVFGDLAGAIKAARTAGHEVIELECDTIAQVKAGIAAGASRLLLDNMPPSKLKECVALNNKRAELEASGGVTLNTIRAIADTGVDYISVGRITQSAPAVDLGLDYQS